MAIAGYCKIEVRSNPFYLWNGGTYGMVAQPWNGMNSMEQFGVLELT